MGIATGICTACLAKACGHETPDYTELHCVSNFSFLRGASHPQELIQRAIELGYKGLALTDECSVAGWFVRIKPGKTWRWNALPPMTSNSSSAVNWFTTAPHSGWWCWLAIREGYGHLCEFITRLRRAVDGKGQTPLTRQGSSPKPCLIACFCFCPIVRPFGPAPRSGALSAQT